MSWQNATATDRLDMLQQMVEIARSDHVDTVVIVSGGINYNVGDIITLTDGTRTHSASFEVTAESGNVITGIRMNEGGAYTVDPDITATTAHTVVPAGGTGATFDLTMTDTSVQTAVVNAGGTGYAVNDVLTVAGGTGVSSTLLVTSVAAGVVDGIRILTNGLYSVDPTTTANAVTGGGGSSATVDLTLGGTWRVERRTQEALSATIGVGGTGYTVGDDLTIVGGLGVGTAAVFNVDTVSAGVVTAVSLLTAGDYEDTPANPAATTGGTGTGCTLNVTYQDAATQEQILIMESCGDAGNDEILVGMKTFTATDVSTFNTVYNWVLLGFTGFNPGLLFQDQPGISPGLTSGAPSTTAGAFFVHKENTAFNPEFWISVRPNRIILVAKVETASTTHYSSMYVGFHNPFATDLEEPYPIYIAGCTSRNNSWYGDTVIGRISGLTDAYRILSRSGPGFIRVAGNWQGVANATVNDGGAPTRSALNDFTVYPAGKPTLAPLTDDLVVSDNAAGIQWDDIIPQSGVPGSPNFQFFPTQNTGDDVRILVPATILATDNPATIIYATIGELDNVFWTTGVSATSEDTIAVGTDRYRIFQNGTQMEVFSFMAIKEE